MYDSKLAYGRTSLIDPATLDYYQPQPCLRTLAVDGTGIIYALTYRIVGAVPSLYLKRSADGGATWTTQLLVGTGTGPLIEGVNVGDVFELFYDGNYLHLMYKNAAGTVYRYARCIDLTQWNLAAGWETFGANKYVTVASMNVRSASQWWDGVNGWLLLIDTAGVPWPYSWDEGSTTWSTGGGLSFTTARYGQLVVDPTFAAHIVFSVVTTKKLYSLTSFDLSMAGFKLPANWAKRDASPGSDDLSTYSTLRSTYPVIAVNTEGLVITGTNEGVTNKVLALSFIGSWVQEEPWPAATHIANASDVRIGSGAAYGPNYEWAFVAVPNPSGLAVVMTRHEGTTPASWDAWPVGLNPWFAPAYVWLPQNATMAPSLSSTNAFIYMAADPNLSVEGSPVAMVALRTNLPSPIPTLHAERTEVVTNILELLRGMLTDPAGAARGTSEWIYPDYPRPNAKTPRVSITRLPATTTEERVSANRVLHYHFRLLIDGWVNVRDTYTINGIKYQGEKLRAWLMDQIGGVIHENRLDMPRIYGVEMPSPSRPVPDIDTDMLREAWTIDVKRQDHPDYKDMRVKIWREAFVFHAATPFYYLQFSDVYQVDRVEGMYLGQPLAFSLSPGDYGGGYFSYCPPNILIWFNDTVVPDEGTTVYVYYRYKVPRYDAALQEEGT